MVFLSGRSDFKTGRNNCVFDNSEFIYELKHDGFRALAYFENGERRLVSRNLKSLRFESLTLALGKLPVKNAIIDGEIVCLDDNGVSQFNWLLSESRANQAFPSRLRRWQLNSIPLSRRVRLALGH